MLPVGIFLLSWHALRFAARGLRYTPSIDSLSTDALAQEVAEKHAGIKLGYQNTVTSCGTNKWVIRLRSHG